MAVGAEIIEETEVDVDAVLEDHGVDNFAALEERTEEVLTGSPGYPSSDPEVEDEVESLLGTVESDGPSEVDASDAETDGHDSRTESSAGSEEIPVSRTDADAIDELFEELDEQAPAVDTDVEADELGRHVFGDDPADTEGYSDEVTDALTSAADEIERYRENELYDCHPERTQFEWVSFDDVLPRW